MINCRYCYKPCRVIKNKTTYWRCDYHGGVVVKYLLATDNNIVDQNWITTILVCNRKDDIYHVVIIDNTEDLIKFRIDKVLPFKYRQPELAQAVISLPFIPDNITPENVMEKLSTYLLFS